MGLAYPSLQEIIMIIKIELDEEDVTEVLELVRDVRFYMEELRQEAQELKRLCDEQKKMS